VRAAPAEHSRCSHTERCALINTLAIALHAGSAASTACACETLLPALVTNGGARNLTRITVTVPHDYISHSKSQSQKRCHAHDAHVPNMASPAFTEHACRCYNALTGHAHRTGILPHPSCHWCRLRFTGILLTTLTGGHRPQQPPVVLACPTLG
jgi:hypothetical protein